MRTAFLKNPTHVMMIQRHFIFTNRSINPIRVPSFRLPCFARKTREYKLSPSSFSSSFCSSSSSSSSASVSKVGLVSWYLGMIKARPILTKSITSALIYTAADLSSQVPYLASLFNHYYLLSFAYFSYKSDFLFMSLLVIEGKEDKIHYIFS